MEFSYTLSEKDYVSASRMLKAKPRKFGAAKTALLCLFAVAILTIVWGVIQHSSGTEAGTPPVYTRSSNSIQPWYVYLFGQIAFFAGLAVVFELFLPDFFLRRDFRKDPRMRREKTVRIDPSGIEFLDGTRKESVTLWAELVYWTEQNGLIVFVKKPSSLLIVKSSYLSVEQANQLRGILAQSLPMR